MKVGSKKIGLWTAILININIILGAGIFINPKILTKFVGAFGFLSYIFAALILLPIVYSIAQLASQYPTAGGMYVYPKKFLNPFLGFISGWGYFLGKTASPALLIHTFVSFFYYRINFLQNVSILFLDFLLIFFLIGINIFGVYIGGKVQFVFITLKTVPILFVIIYGFIFFNPSFFSFSHFVEYNQMINSLPTAIFVLLSFEMVCSIGHMIKNPSKNINYVIFYSFLIVAIVATLFQFLMIGLFGSSLANLSEPVSGWINKMGFGFNFLPAILQTFIFGSIISGGFGSLAANCWNLYKLAEDDYLPYSGVLKKINKNNVPWVSLIIEGLLACLLLGVSINLVSLQNMTVLGIAIAYLLNSVSTFVIKTKIAKFISFLAIASSLYIIFLCFQNLFIFGISISFSLIFFSGILILVLKKILKRSPRLLS
ncbi:APC family permease [Candidatus Dependentiae bacterium]